MAWTKVVTESSDSNIAQTAAKAVILETARTISTTGEVTVTTGTFDGSGNVTGAATITDNVVDEANLKISNSASDGMFLQYKDGTDELTWATPTDVSTVANLTDTTIDSPADNEVLAWNGSDTWINQTASEAGLQPLADDLTTLASCQTGAATALAALTATEIGVIDGLTASTTNLNNLDLGLTATGTAIASKAVVLDANKDYTGIRNFTITGELDAATLDISGDVDIDGRLEADGLSISSTVVTSSAAELNILDGVTATSTELNYLDITTLGASEASKAVTADASGHVTISDGAYDFDIASHDGTNGLKLGGVLVTADAADLNYAKDLYDTGVTSTEFDYLDGVSSNVQTQLGAKAELAGDSSQDFSVQNLSVTGNLSITGTSEIRNTTTETINVADNTIVLNSDKSATADVDAGIVVERGGDGNNKSIYWDEGDDKWKFGDSSSAVVAGTYQGDVVSMDVNSSYADGSTVVPIGHFQYDTNSSTLYVRTS